MRLQISLLSTRVGLGSAILALVVASRASSAVTHPTTESRTTIGNVRDEIDAARARIAALVAQYHDPVGPRTWIDGARLWYVESSRDGARRWWLCDATKTGAEARVPLFDHAAVAALVAAVGDAAPDRLHDRLPVRGLSVSNDRVAIALEGREQPVVCALGGAIVAVSDPTARALLETSLKPGKRRSRGQGASVHLTFENRLDEAVEIFWIDRANAERSYGRIEAGDSRRQQTFGGHAWFVRTVLGRELGHAMANDLDRVIVIGDAPPAEPEPIDTQDGQRETQSEAELRVPRAEKAESDAPTNVIPPYEVRAERGSLQFVDGAGRTFFQAEGPDASRREANGFTGGFWVSPTRDAVFAMRVDRPEQRRVTIIESTPKDQLQPRVRSFDYVKPGDPIDTAIPHLFRVELDASSALVAREVPLDRTLFATPWSIDRVRMLPNGREVAFLYNQRGHQVVRLVAIDLATGAARSACTPAASAPAPSGAAAGRRPSGAGSRSPGMRARASRRPSRVPCASRAASSASLADGRKPDAWPCHDLGVRAKEHRALHARRDRAADQAVEPVVVRTGEAKLPFIDHAPASLGLHAVLAR